MRDRMKRCISHATKLWLRSVWNYHRHEEGFFSRLNGNLGMAGVRRHRGASAEKNKVGNERR